MTDFGRRAGAHKTTHQDGGADEISIAGLSGQAADDQSAAAHALAGGKHSASTLAQLNAKVSDAALDDSGDPRTPSAHKASHQDGGADEISVAGLVGTTPRALLGDATAGRVFRSFNFIIDDGTAAATLKCWTSGNFNGDAIAETDNIAKDATTGHFTLDDGGLFLTIENSGLSGNVLHAMGVFVINTTGASLMVHVYVSDGDIVIAMRSPIVGGPTDLTTLVDTGNMYVIITYITDA